MSSAFVGFVLLGGLASIIGFIVFFLMRWKKNSLPAKFASLNPVAGKSKAHIVSVVGQPNSVTAMDGGKTMLQWIVPGYHIRLIFNGETCEGVNHEFQHVNRY